MAAGVHVVSRPRSRMNGPNNVRVVLGVRSSAHYPVPATEPGGQWGVFRIPGSQRLVNRSKLIQMKLSHFYIF